MVPRAADLFTAAGRLQIGILALRMLPRECGDLRMRADCARNFSMND